MKGIGELREGEPRLLGISSDIMLRSEKWAGYFDQYSNFVSVNCPRFIFIFFCLAQQWFWFNMIVMMP